MTARTPSSLVPLAAQSREEPVPYSPPRQDDQGNAFFPVAHRCFVDRHLFPGRPVHGPAPLRFPGASWFLRRILAKVPRIITSWLPRREP